MCSSSCRTPSDQRSLRPHQGNPLARTTKLVHAAPVACARAQLGGAQGIGRPAGLAIRPVELVHEARRGCILYWPQRCHDGARAVREESIREAEDTLRRVRRHRRRSHRRKAPRHRRADRSARCRWPRAGCRHSSAPWRRIRLRYSADCSGASSRATAWVAKCSTDNAASQLQHPLRRRVETADLDLLRAESARATARASSAEYGRRVSLLRGCSRAAKDSRRRPAPAAAVVVRVHGIRNHRNAVAVAWRGCVGARMAAPAMARRRSRSARPGLPVRSCHAGNAAKGTPLSGPSAITSRRFAVTCSSNAPRRLRCRHSA